MSGGIVRNIKGPFMVDAKWETKVVATKLRELEVNAGKFKKALP